VRSQEPGKSLDRIARHNSAQVIGGSQHRLAVGVSALGAALPPQRGVYRIAIHAEGVVKDHAEPRHRRCTAIIQAAPGLVTCMGRHQRGATRWCPRGARRRVDGALLVSSIDARPQ
jgi:hypothetical protein